jgi:DNA-binding transcriptional ArsR family regulator
VALRLVDDFPATSEEIADAVELAPRTVREHLARLRDRGLAEKLRLEDEVLHLPTAWLEAWAEDVGEGYPRPWGDEDG